MCVWNKKKKVKYKNPSQFNEQGECVGVRTNHIFAV